MLKYILNFFSLSILFNKRPLSIVPPGLYIMISLMGILLVIAIVLKVLSRKEKDRLKRQIFEKFSKPLLWLSILGFFYTWFMYERLPYLSMRIWFLVGIIWGLIWLWFPVKFLFVTAPRIRKETEQRKNIKQYLPQKK